MSRQLSPACGRRGVGGEGSSFKHLPPHPNPLPHEWERGDWFGPLQRLVAPERRRGRGSHTPHWSVGARLNFHEKVSAYLSEQVTSNYCCLASGGCWISGVVSGFFSGGFGFFSESALIFSSSVVFVSTSLIFASI